jgi:hypothetical protein
MFDQNMLNELAKMKVDRKRKKKPEEELEDIEYEVYEGDNSDFEEDIPYEVIDENFDEGEIIHQSRFRIEAGDDLEMIKFKGQQMEHLHYPKVVEQLLKKMKS